MFSGVVESVFNVRNRREVDARDGSLGPPSLPAPGALAARDPRLNPALAYEQSVSLGSRRAVRSVLRAFLSLALSRPASWEECCAFPWWQVTRPYADRLRALLVEARRPDGAPRYAPRSVNRAISILRGVLTAAWNADQMPNEQYQKAIKVPGVDKDTRKAGRALGQDEVRVLLATCRDSFDEREGTMLAAMISVMFAGGLRRAEVAQLDRSSVSPYGRALDVLGKRQKRRTVHLPVATARRLEAWLRHRGNTPGPLFPARHGGRYSPDAIGRLIASVRDRAGTAFFTPHDLRRSYGTHHLALGGDLSLVRDMMGHEDIRTTAIYDRRGEEAQRAAAFRLDVPPPEDLDADHAARFVEQTRREPPKPAGYTLEEIFACDDPFGDGDPVSRAAITAGIRTGRFTASMVQLAERECSRAELAEFSGHTDEHKALCVLAADYFRSRGFMPLGGANQCRYPTGGVADVAEPGLRLFAECGYTQSRKVIEALEDGRDVLLVPYLWTKPIVGFLFHDASGRTRAQIREEAHRRVTQQSSFAIGSPARKGP